MPKGCWYVLRCSDGVAVAQSERQPDAEAVAEAMGSAFKVESSHAGAHWLRWDDELRAAEAAVASTDLALCSMLDDISGDEIDLELARQHPAQADYLRARRFQQLLQGEQSTESAALVSAPQSSGDTRSHTSNYFAAVESGRYSLFRPSEHPRATSCPAWKSLMQFRHELLTNPRQDSGADGWWSAWIGTAQKWLYGGGNWGPGYYAPGHRITTPDAAVCVADAKQQVARMTTKDPRRAEVLPGDDLCVVLFLPGETYLSFYGAHVIDLSKPFPALHERARIVEWIEAWIDRVTLAEVTGRNPWEEEPQVALSPTQLKELGRTAAEAVAPELIDRAALKAAEKVASVIESMGTPGKDDAPVAKLPKLKAHDRQAWQLATLHGMTQDKVSVMLNKEHGTTYTQGQVSRMIARAKAHADANGLSEKVAGPIDRPRTVDPARLELGARIDKRKARPSEMERESDDE